MSQPKPFSFTRHLKRNAMWWVVGLLLVIVIAFYLAGYRIGPGLSIVKVGTLTLTDVPAGASVYVNDKLRSVTKDAGDYRLKLTPSTHTIIVSVPDTTPWQDAITVPEGGTLSVRPIILPAKPDGQVLRDEERATAFRTVAATPLPSEVAALRAGCMDVYVAQNRIIGKAVAGCENPPAFLCTDGECGPTVLFAPIEKISSVALYPGRTDTLFFTLGDGVYVIDTDPREPRFFAPFIRAITPRVAAGAGESQLLLVDADNAYRFTF